MNKSLLFILTLSLTASCSNESQPLKGMWQLQQIATPDTTIYESTIYYSFDLGVCFLQNIKQSCSCYGTYTLSNSHLTMGVVTDTCVLNLAHYYYWGDSLARCFEVKQLSSRTLILAADNTIYTYRKF